jgi:hypothetical protein
VTLKLLLENTDEASVVDTRDTLVGATPLMLAAAAGHLACVRSALFLVSIFRYLIS